MSLDIVIAGASGRMGRVLIEAVQAAPDMHLFAALERPGSPFLGRDAGELVGALAQALVHEDLDAALHESAVILVKMIAPMMPHLAEECWARLGYNTLLAKEPWPEADPALLVDDRVTLAVQVNGKRRGEITLARAATNAEAEAAALALEPVVKALEGRPAKKVIVVPQRIVNIVA